MEEKKITGVNRLVGQENSRERVYIVIITSLVIILGVFIAQAVMPGKIDVVESRVRMNEQKIAIMGQQLDSITKTLEEVRADVKSLLKK